MSITTTTRAPKRMMQRRWSLVNAPAVANVEVNNTLHSVTEKKTLTRIRITGSISPTGTNAIPKLHLAIHIERNGKRVIDNPATSENLDETEPLSLILRDVFGSNRFSDIGTMIGHRVEIDTKIQRKLDPGDLLVASMISSGSTAVFDAFLSVTNWFKLA